MSHSFAEKKVQVDYVFSGRDRDKYFDMEGFGDWQCLSGLTFAVNKGKIRPLKTIVQSHPLQLLKDIKSLPVEDYDLVISDFEPVTAWAAHRAGRECLGLGHQYAFEYPIPKQGDNRVTRTIMKMFAPTTHSIGLHWYHFQQPILPPIVEHTDHETSMEADKIIVYLPFEQPEQVVKLLEKIEGYQFLYYGNFPEVAQWGNVTVNPVSRDNFQRDLARCGGVICNAGFELASESLQLGKKLLVKPLQGQMEQLSNARALSELKLGVAVEKLSTQSIQDWLENFNATKIHYPKVADHIVDWVLKGNLAEKNQLVEQLWEETDSGGLESFEPYCSDRGQGQLVSQNS